MQNTVIKLELAYGVEGFFSVPNSGFGHTSDEQPLPYLEKNGCALTPRFGGEEFFAESNNQSLPLPKGKLRNEWPISQKVFNLFRRRINIYWRNLFLSPTRTDKQFLFIEQLNYLPNCNGFMGDSPLINFERKFINNQSELIVTDKIYFKKNIAFDDFYYAMVPVIKCDKQTLQIDVIVNVEQNYFYKIQSSTGWSQVSCKKLKNATFKSGDVLDVTLVYRVKA